MLERKSVRVMLRTGEVLRGQRRAGYDGVFELEVLRFGVRLLAVPADQGDLANIAATEEPTDECRMLVSRIHVPPFGARGSVVQFNGFASGIKQLLVRGLLLPGLNYDGFSLIIPRIVSKAVDLAVKAVGGVTGWNWTGGHKGSAKLTVRIDDIKGAETFRLAAAAQLAGRLGGCSIAVFREDRSAHRWQPRWREGGGPCTEELVAPLRDWVTMLMTAPFFLHPSLPPALFPELFTRPCLHCVFNHLRHPLETWAKGPFS